MVYLQEAAWIFAHATDVSATIGPVESDEVVEGAEDAGKYDLLDRHFHRTESTV